MGEIYCCALGLILLQVRNYLEVQALGIKVADSWPCVESILCVKPSVHIENCSVPHTFCLVFLYHYQTLSRFPSCRAVGGYDFPCFICCKHLGRCYNQRKQLFAGYHFWLTLGFWWPAANNFHITLVPFSQAHGIVEIIFPCRNLVGLSVIFSISASWLSLLLFLCLESGNNRVAISCR